MTKKFLALTIMGVAFTGTAFASNSASMDSNLSTSTPPSKIDMASTTEVKPNEYQTKVGEDLHKMNSDIKSDAHKMDSKIKGEMNKLDSSLKSDSDKIKKHVEGEGDKIKSDFHKMDKKIEQKMDEKKNYKNEYKNKGKKEYRKYMPEPVKK